MTFVVRGFTKNRWWRVALILIFQCDGWEQSVCLCKEEFPKIFAIITDNAKEGSFTASLGNGKLDHQRFTAKAEDWCVTSNSWQGAEGSQMDSSCSEGHGVCVCVCKEEGLASQVFVCLKEVQGTPSSIERTDQFSRLSFLSPLHPDAPCLSDPTPLESVSAWVCSHQKILVATATGFRDEGLSKRGGSCEFDINEKRREEEWSSLSTEANCVMVHVLIFMTKQIQTQWLIILRHLTRDTSWHPVIENKCPHSPILYCITVI